MGAITWLCLVLSALLAIYLTIALLKPESFE